MSKKKCFVIMPFSQTTKEHTEDYWTSHFEDFIKPIIEKIDNIEVYRSEALRSDIVRKIIYDLADSDIVIADLTDLNPNVFYELGIRQSISYRTITIAENNTDLPFDISTKGTLFYYPKDHIENQEFTEDFIDAINDCIKNPERSDSIVLDTIKHSEQREVLEKNLKTKLRQCYQSLKKICDFYYQKKEKLHNQELDIPLNDNTVFLAVKKIQKYKNLCLKHFDISFEANNGELSQIGRSHFKILSNTITIEVFLNDGQFPLNSYYFLKTGNQRVRAEKEEVNKFLERIRGKIREI